MTREGAAFMDQLVQELLAAATFKPSTNARRDLESGQVDTRLVYVLWILAQKHIIEVSMIKTGHPLGPVSRAGIVNSHYYYRAADIVAIDNKPIVSHAADPEVVDVGRMLRHLSPQERPDTIFGPEAWHTTLNYPASAGFISDSFHNQIHADHIHVSFELETGTGNEEGHIEGALHMPFYEVEQRLDELNPTRLLAVLCAGGMGAWRAARLPETW
jgi:hypothetical protein